MKKLAASLIAILATLPTVAFAQPYYGDPYSYPQYDASSYYNTPSMYGSQYDPYSYYGTSYRPTMYGSYSPTPRYPYLYDTNAYSRPTYFSPTYASPAYANPAIPYYTDPTRHPYDYPSRSTRANSYISPLRVSSQYLYQQPVSGISSYGRTTYRGNPRTDYYPQQYMNMPPYSPYGYQPPTTYSTTNTNRYITVGPYDGSRNIGGLNNYNYYGY